MRFFSPLQSSKGAKNPGWQVTCEVSCLVPGKYPQKPRGRDMILLGKMGSLELVLHLFMCSLSSKNTTKN